MKASFDKKGKMKERAAANCVDEDDNPLKGEAKKICKKYIKKALKEEFKAQKKEFCPKKEKEDPVLEQMAAGNPEKK